MSSERRIQSEILLALAEHGLSGWRQNVGTAWAGDVQRLKDGSVLIRNPRPIHAGLCKGSSDIIGLRPLVVTPEMIGQTIAQFAAIEVKNARGRLTDDQKRFQDFVAAKGGLAVVARSVADLEDAL